MYASEQVLAHGRAGVRTSPQLEWRFVVHCEPCVTAHYRIMLTNPGHEIILCKRVWEEWKNRFDDAADSSSQSVESACTSTAYTVY